MRVKKREILPKFLTPVTFDGPCFQIKATCGKSNTSTEVLMINKIMLFQPAGRHTSVVLEFMVPVLFQHGATDMTVQEVEI